MARETGNSDTEILAAAIRARTEALEAQRSRFRADRELWVARNFLSNLEIPFEDSELIPVPDDPPDVRFREANFEVKEILDQGRRRHDEYKASLKKAKLASSPLDLLEHATPRELPITDVCSEVAARSSALAAKYSSDTRRTLDLLFYVDHLDVFGYIRDIWPPTQPWAQFGFRSISVLMGRLSAVLYFNDDAPEFLKAGGIRLVQPVKTR